MIRPFTFYGTGLSLMSFRKEPGGTLNATLWLTVLFLPLIPISAWRIRPSGTSGMRIGAVVGDRFHFQVLRQEPLDPGLVLKTYAQTVAFAALGLGPFAALVFFLKPIITTPPVPAWAIALEFAAVIWPIVLLGIQNNRKHELFGG